MKAITLYQPYASAVACGLKQFETRSWETEYRGEIAIHAGKSKEMLEFDACSPEQLGVESFEDLPLGAIVATATLVDCIKVIADGTLNEGIVSLVVGKNLIALSTTEIKLGDYRRGRYAWQLANVKKLDEPIFVRGKQRLWEWDS